MNSWAVSACYPRSTFYPLSDGPSIQNHRITMTCFRTCSTCLSRSQAPLCHYTRRTISDRAEGTFALLRFKVSQLSYTDSFKVQCEGIVKVHGVFPSCGGNAASSQRFQLR